MDRQLRSAPLRCVQDEDGAKDARIAQLSTELDAARAELEELHQRYWGLVENLATATVTARSADGTPLGEVRLLDELLRPGGERHLQIISPAPQQTPSEAPETWAAWLRHRRSRR
jgi:hypothetical protein